jgi:predicted PurR-regulated permease PerM
MSERLVSTPSLPSRDTELPVVADAGGQQPSTVRGRRIALSILLFLALLAVARIAAPLWVGIAFGTMMAFTAQPAYRFMSARFGQRRALAAGLATMFAGVVVAALGGLVVWILTRQLLELVAILQHKLAAGSLADLIGERGVRLLGRVGIDRDQIAPRVTEELSRATGWAASAATTVLQTASTAALGLLVSLFSMYYVLVEWPHLAVRLERVLPLNPRHTRALVLEFRDVARSALVGAIATALVQGALAAVGFAIAGVPRALTWGFLTVLASFVPLIGTALVYVPIGVYLILTGSTGSGVMVLLWGVIVVMAIADYVIRPRIVGGKGQGHPFLLLIGILGGLEVFGLAGLFVGPVVMTMFVAILRIFERELDA